MAVSGYKTIWKLVNTTTNVKVTQETTRCVLKVIDPEGVALRSAHRLRRRVYTNKAHEEIELLTKVHDDWAKNATSRVFTCLYYKQKEKTASPISTNFELVRKINNTNFLTNFKQTIHIEKTAPRPESHIFPPIVTIFELFHDREKNHVRKTAPPPGGHVFQPTGTIFKLKKRHILYTNILAKSMCLLDMIWANVLTKFHEDRRRNAVSSVSKAKVWLRTQKFRTDGQKDGRMDNAKTIYIASPLAGDNQIKINNRHITFKRKKMSLNLVILKELNKSVTIYVKAI
ncbi:hypothetical protein DPMN_178726 [Dreissena polymorpha]|uniref:Uncharacterized protein n=1 Tax=Dreissena polymorpha TaxID=45954 RepID=A0A9D4ECQ2_DREPO|nr:hypothetical protein DPMN_178726 [Dreissena polymorpha]